MQVTPIWGEPRNPLRLETLRVPAAAGAGEHSSGTAALDRACGRIDRRAIDERSRDVLQSFRDNHLGYVVGEPSGGTNGDMNMFTVPDGFRVRFTGLRISGAGGTAIQGRGIVPDQVHPTLEGVRAKRDQVLEAGTPVGQRLAQK